MATAIKKLHEVVTVTLELSEREAGILLELTYAIAGPPAGPRSAVDSIREALYALGIKRLGDVSGVSTLTGPDGDSDAQ